MRKFEEQIHDYTKNKKSEIHQAILLWNCIYHTVNMYRKKHPEWLFVRHEDLSMNPVKQFKSIYKTFDLEFTTKVEMTILKNSSPDNLTDGLLSKKRHRIENMSDRIKRNSKENILNWKKRLTQDEIELIKENTHEVSSLFYEEHEW